MIQCDGCSGVYPQPKNPGEYFVQDISFRIAVNKWETFWLCTACDKEITKRALSKVRGKKLSDAQAAIRMAAVAAQFVKERMGHSLGFHKYATFRSADEKPSATKGGKMVLKLFKDGDVMGIQTDCETENAFIESFSDALQSLIDKGAYEHDWAFQLSHWLPQVVDICNSYRGYKTTLVRKSIVLTAGDGGDLVYEEKPLPQNAPRMNGFLDNDHDND